MVDRYGLRTDPEKIESIVSFLEPKPPKAVRRFLGIASWYRRFIKNFSMVTAPLNNLVKKLPKGRQFEFTDEARSACIQIKELLVSAPILSVPKFDRAFLISTDASESGLGAAISQLDDEGCEVAVAYASSTLTKSERNHSVTEKELNALIFALDKFRGYIEGSPYQTKV